MPNIRPLTIDKIATILFFCAVIVAVVWVVGLLENVLLPFCLACLISYMLDPLVELNRRWFRLRGRGVASFLTLGEVGGVLGLLVYFFAPSVAEELGELADMIKFAVAHDSELADTYPLLHKLIDDHFSLRSLREIMETHSIDQLLNSGAAMLGKSLDLLMHTVEWLITFIYVIFILIDYPYIMRGFRLMVPPRYRKGVYRVADDIKENMNHYFRGQALIAACAAVFYCVGFSIIGLPLAIVLGLLVGFLYMIPYFQYVTLVPVAIVCFISTLDQGSFWVMMGECLIVYFISQCICDYILTPKIMGKALGLNPAIILLSLSVWGTLMGIIGMIVALPLTTLLLGYYQEFVIDAPDPKAKAPSTPPSVHPPRKSH